MYEDIMDDILIEEIADIELRLRELKLQLKESKKRQKEEPFIWDPTRRAGSMSWRQGSDHESETLSRKGRNGNKGES